MRLLSWFLTATLVVVFSGCSLLPQEEIYEVPVLEEPPPSRTVTYEVKVGPIRDVIKSLGRVSPVLETNLYFTKAGIIKTMETNPQTRVEKGQILAQLEIEDKMHSLRLAKISLEASRLKLKRAEELAAIEGLTNSYELQLQRLELQREEENYRYLEEQIELSTIRAPYDGIISRIYKQPGNTVKEYEVVFVIQDPSELEVTIELTNEDDFNRITIGMPVRVEVSRNNWVNAYITQIPTYSERNALGPERDRRVRVRFESPDVPIKYNDLYTAEIIVREEQEAIIIPTACLHEFMGRSYVRVLDGDTRREVDVEVGIREPTQVQILSGLEPGMLVVGR
ncbi:MAG TPA: efflux RND transporter periplasmic adaptor subunit [Firmicutes bacterium]|nr:efflux RND transporter periplasmic adaptor subunit [Bacillota bacterium]